MRGLPTLKRQRGLPQTTTKRQRECDTNGLRVPTRPTSITKFTTTTTIDNSSNARNNNRTLKCSTHNKKRRYNTPTTTNQEWITTNGFANSILQTDSEAAMLQLGEHVSRELGLRFRARPPHSHQRNGAVERLRRTLFDQLRAVKLQWALSLRVPPARLPQQSLPWLLQHSVFILNKYLVKDTGTTAHQSNYHKAYNNPICPVRRSSSCRHSLLGQLQATTDKSRSEDKGIWIGKDPTTDEHLIALPPVYDNHPSVTGSIYKCRGVTRLPRPNMWDTTFLATIQ